MIDDGALPHGNGLPGMPVNAPVVESMTNPDTVPSPELVTYK